MGVDLEQSLYALDSTPIDLCLSLFPWAKFRRRKAAVKMHTLLDLHGNIPTFIRVTSGDVHDVNLGAHILVSVASIDGIRAGDRGRKSPDNGSYSLNRRTTHLPLSAA